MYVFLKKLYFFKNGKNKFFKKTDFLDWIAIMAMYFIFYDNQFSIQVRELEYILTNIVFNI